MCVRNDSRPEVAMEHYIGIYVEDARWFKKIVNWEQEHWVQEQPLPLLDQYPAGYQCPREEEKRERKGERA